MLPEVRFRTLGMAVGFLTAAHAWKAKMVNSALDISNTTYPSLRISTWLVSRFILNENILFDPFQFITSLDTCIIKAGGGFVNLPHWDFSMFRRLQLG